MAFCANCGKEITDDSAFCPGCGAEVKPVAVKSAAAADPDVSPKKRLVAALLAYFAGGVGAHDFYLGKIGAGIAKIILFLLGIILIILGAVMIALDIDEVSMIIGFVGYGLGFLLSMIPSFVAFVEFIMALCGVLKDRNGKKVKEWT